MPAIGRISTYSPVPLTRRFSSGLEPIRIVARVQIEHVRRRVQLPQSLVDVQRLVGTRLGERAAQDHLEDIAIQDVPLGLLDHGLVFGLNRVGPRIRQGTCRPRAVGKRAEERSSNRSSSRLSITVGRSPLLVIMQLTTT